MAKEFKLPELGENIEKAQILKVLVKPGDTVKKDQTLFELETDKATVEVPSEFDGTIETVNVNDGDEIPVGTVVLTYNEAGTGTQTEVKEEAAEVTEKPVEKVEEPAQVKQETEPVSTGKPGIFEFKLPELGEGITSAQILKVLVKPGDNVEKDQTLFELETDKATVEVPSEVSGTIKSVNVKDGDTANIGDVMLVIETTSSTPIKAKEPVQTSVPKEVKTETTTAKAPTPSSDLSQPSPLTAKKAKTQMPQRIAPASPSVRRFAREIGIDIHEVRGSGPGGRISVEDVKAFAKNLNEQIKKSGSAVGIKTEALPDFSKWGEVDVQPMNNIRKKTAQHLSYAWSTVPHVTQFDKADITELEKLRKKYGEKVKAQGGKLTVTSILLKIVAAALKEFPQFNASVDMQNNTVIYKKYYNIGVAVDTEKGLLVPVIKDVDKKSITELSIELSEISAKARSGKLTLDEMQGGNFSISNLGGIGGTAFTPIVNSPEVAILGISRGSYEQVYINGEFQARLMLPLSLSYDHRIIDGADGARFIRWISTALEEPFSILL
ncbi:MAG: dihydrolipoyllysine-residue acetyltransferase [Ignavibacteria bacterium]|nr:MAG: dihydrolipoyllysine-residue acetyltransferase [Ignavibacteria bacterium]